MKNLKQIPLFLLVILSCIFITYIGYRGSDSYYESYDYNIKETPYITIVMKGLYEGISPAKVLLVKKETVPDTKNNDTDSDKDGTKVEGADASQTDDSTGSSDASQTPAGTDTATGSTDTTSADGTVVAADGNAVVAAPREFELVEDNYFDDALFIGDSRTIGFSQYAGLVNATYYADTGINIYSIMEKEIVTVDGQLKKITIDEALQKNTFGKIYIMLGINELGRGTTQDFVDQYSLVIARIRELQPRAIIFIQSIMHVSAEKAASDAIFNNTNINERNEALKALANSQDIFYVDVNEAVTDADGNLYSEYSFDGIHLKAEYIGLWKDYLKQHGIETTSVPKVCYEWEAPGYVEQ